MFRWRHLGGARGYESRAIARGQLGRQRRHGYYVATYVVGRYKNTRMYVDPFAFTVSRMSPELEEVPLRFQVIDFAVFTLSYELDGKQQVLMGGFESPLRTDEIEIEVKGLLKAGGDSALWWSNVAMGTYELLVFKY
ncbi:MAG: hypothetical protein R2818_12905 [Flavobacteriales bacterium]